jgi:tetratricopeptide (TPR) repeat protein
LIEPLLHAERLLLMGLLDQAEAVYRRIVEQDPRNAIAVMGLARVAVERGDMEEAHRQAARALRIDPENAAAAAMEARTAELLGRTPGVAGSRDQGGAAVHPDREVDSARPDRLSGPRSLLRRLIDR